jgi:hypothetical protein
MAARPSDWRQLAAAEAALRDGAPGARSSDAIRTFLKLVRTPLAPLPLPPCLRACLRAWMRCLYACVLCGGMRVCVAWLCALRARVFIASDATAVVLRVRVLCVGVQAREHACRRSPLVAELGAELLRRGGLSQDERTLSAHTQTHASRKPYALAAAAPRTFSPPPPASPPARTRIHAGWTVHEQVVVAACDSGEAGAAEAALTPLEARFPGSLRVGAHPPFHTPPSPPLPHACASVRMNACHACACVPACLVSHALPRAFTHF